MILLFRLKWTFPPDRIQRAQSTLRRFSSDFLPRPLPEQVRVCPLTTAKSSQSPWETKPLAFHPTLLSPLRPSPPLSWLLHPLSFFTFPPQYPALCTFYLDPLERNGLKLLSWRGIYKFRTSHQNGDNDPLCISLILIVMLTLISFCTLTPIPKASFVMLV